MQLARSKTAVFLAALTTLLMAVATAWALEPGADGYFHTGSGIRVKSIAFVDVNVYEINHFIKKLPEQKSKRAVIDLDVDKKLVWKMKRDVDADAIRNALKEAFAKNSYSDGAKIGKFLGAFTKELAENAGVKIVYSAEKKATTVTVDGGGSATIEGVDFMKGVWSIWFGNIDQPKLGDQLISKF